MKKFNKLLGFLLSLIILIQNINLSLVLANSKLDLSNDEVLTGSSVNINEDSRVIEDLQENTDPTDFSGEILADYSVEFNPKPLKSNSSMVQNLLHIAQVELNEAEGAGGYSKYGAWYGYPYSHWCHMFVSWCANEAGLLNSYIPKTADCDTGKNWFINSNNAKYEISSYYGGTYKPQPGDIIYFSGRYTQSDSTHVGIVESSTNSTVTVIEGNSTNSAGQDVVQRVRYNLSNGYIIGYGVPAYNINSGDTGDNIEYSVDESYNNTMTGFHTSGWVIAESDINRLTYSINGGAEKTYTNWIDRPDVYTHYPSYPKTPCGFNIVLDWSNFKDGKNTVVLKAYSNGGNSKVISDVYFYMAAPSGYSIGANKPSTYVYNNDKNNLVNVYYNVSNKAYCTATIFIEKNGKVVKTENIGTNKNVDLGFPEAGTYYVYLHIKNSAGTVKGTSSSGVTVITVKEKTVNHTLTYNANGGTGAPSKQTITNGSVTLSKTKPQKPSYVFKGWATSPNGAVKYQPGAKCSFNGNVTLYAVWSPYKHTVAYNANGGTGAPSAQTKTADVRLNLSTKKPTRSGYTFKGWATSPNGAVKYQPGANYTPDQNGGTVTLYAIWNPYKHTVAYNANGGTGAPTQQIKTAGVQMNLSNQKPTRKGYTFQGWATSATGAVKYQPGANYTPDQNGGTVTLYAIWKPITYTVTYNANGGTGAPPSQTKYDGVALELSKIKPTRSGYTFKGWTTTPNGSPSGSMLIFMSGSTISLNKNVILYAVWEKNTVTDKPAVSVIDVSGQKGETVDVKFEIKNNPGIAVLGFDVYYDTSAMMLKSVKSGNVFTSSEITEGVINKNPYTVSAMCATGNKTNNDNIVTMTFKINDTCKAGKYNIRISNIEAYNIDEKSVSFEVINGIVNVTNVMVGDINNDGIINRNDLLRFGKYFAGQSVEINKSASDINIDGRINRNDLLRLGKYFAGWDVKIG